MKQLLLPEAYNGEKSWALKGPDVHYLKNVLRLMPGTSISGIDHNGQKWDINIIEISNKECRINLARKSSPENPGPRLNLFQCIPKGKKLDRICREAAECGVSSIVPVLSLHSIPRGKEDHFSQKNERYEGIIKEAIQQSGTSIITRIGNTIKLEDIVTEKDSLNLFFHQEKLNNTKLNKLITESSYKTINILIGPEGGLSEDEIKNLVSKGFNAVYLGENVLRTETAAVYAVAAVKTVLLEYENA